jgi:hypothetical protein
MALRQPSDSSGDLRQDLKQIAIDRIGQEEYDAMDNISKQKMDAFTQEQAIAMQAFLQRQELNITDMEAFGVIERNEISIAGGNVTGGAVAGPGAPVVGASILATNPARNSNKIKFRVQISNTSNKVGVPEVRRMVKRTLVKFLRIFY